MKPSLYIRCEEDTNFKYEFYHDNCTLIPASFARQYLKNGKCIYCPFTIPSILLLDETNNYIVWFNKNKLYPNGFVNRGTYYPINSTPEAAKLYKLVKIEI